jgi:hypothetical protein
MPKYKVMVKLPWPGQTQKVTRQITIEANNSMTAVLQARGQYGSENVFGGALEIKEIKTQDNSNNKSSLTSTSYTRSSVDRKELEADFKRRENDLIKDVIKLSEEKYGKAEFKKMIGKNPKEWTFKEAMDFNRREVNKGSVLGKIKNFIDDDEKYRKEKGIVDWLTKDVRKIGNFVKDKLKKK